MRAITTLCILFGAWSYGQAQPVSPEAYLKQQSARLQREILTQQISRSLPNARTAGTDKRLIAQSLYISNTLTDSIHHYYSDTRGSSHPNDRSYFSSDYGLYTKDPFDLLEAIQYIKSDSCLWYGDLNTNPNINQAMYNKYDIHNKVIREELVSGSDHRTALIEYNAAGKESVLRVWESGSAPPDTLFHYFGYDGQNRLILDSVIEGNNHSYKIRYHYNSAGLPERMEWYRMDTISDHTIYTYDAQDRLLASEEQMRARFGPPGWFSTYRDTFGYTGNATQHTYYELQQWNIITTAWEGLITRTYGLNASGGIVTSYEIHTSSGDTIEALNYFYTPEGLYDRIEDIVPDLYTLYFHYETYSTTAGLPVISDASGGALKIYPNPAHTILNISVQEDMEVAGLAICDITGKMIRNYPADDKKTYRIDISDLPAGSYLVRSSGNRPVVQKFSVIR